MKIHNKTQCWAILTNHAVEQFASRFIANGDASNAEDELISLLNTSKKCGKTNKGDTIYVSSFRSEIRMVVKDRNVCITVLPPGNIQSALDTYSQEIEEISKTILTKEEELSCRIKHLELSISDIELKKNKLKLSIKDKMDKLNDIKGSLSNEMFKLKSKISQLQLMKRND